MNWLLEIEDELAEAMYWPGSGCDQELIRQAEDDLRAWKLRGVGR